MLNTGSSAIKTTAIAHKTHQIGTRWFSHWAILLIACGSSALGQPQFTISTVAGGIAPALPAAPTAVSIGGVKGIAVDGSANFYFTSQLHCVFKVSAGSLTLVAGTCRPGYSGDGGSATNAQLNGPVGIAVDGVGNVFIADRNNQRVRKVTPGGVISTVAGNGTAGYSGDNGQATAAQLFGPSGVAVDSSGNLYIADSFNNVIRKVTAGGIITTVAGGGAPGFFGDGGPATSAALNNPFGVALDQSGNLYIADQGNHRIREVSAGNISTVAGSATRGFSGDGGLATSAALNGPGAVFVDTSNNIYIADQFNNRVRWVSHATGIIQTLVGNGTAGFVGDGGPALSAEISSEVGVAVSSAGNLYLSDTGNNRVREVIGGNISTIAGNGFGGYSGDGIAAASAMVAAPSSLAMNSSGDLFVADTANNRIRKITVGGIISTIAGNGTPGFSGDGGSATSAQLNFPEGVAVDAAGNVFVADTQNHRIRQITTGGTINTIAGTGVPGYSGEGTATSAQLNYPAAVAVDSSGNVLISDSVNNRIRKITGGVISTIAGNGTSGFLGDGGTATSARLNSPAGIALDGAGNLFIADRFNNRIRKVVGGIISTVAGNGSPGYSGDAAAATSAMLNFPYGVAVDASGNLFITDLVNNRVRYVSAGGTIYTIAGNGIGGSSGDGGTATNAEVDSPTGIALSSVGKIYVAESLGNDIRQLTATLAGMQSPTPGSTFGSASVTFQWSTAYGADQYWLDVGNVAGSGDISAGALTATSRLVTGLPCDGRTLYVQLFTHLNGAWQTPQRYTYRASSSCTSSVAGVFTPASSKLTVANVSAWNTTPGKTSRPSFLREPLISRRIRDYPSMLT